MVAPTEESDLREAARFSTRGMLGFTAFVAAVTAAAVALRSPEVAAAAVVLFVAWQARRFDVAHLAPLCVWAVGALVLVGTLAMLRANDNLFAFMAVFPFVLLGGVALLIAAGGFLACAAKAKSRRLQIGNIVALFACLMTGVL